MKLWLLLRHVAVGVGVDANAGVHVVDEVGDVVDGL